MSNFTELVNTYYVLAEENDEAAVEFLPRNLVMVDCEMTGVIPSRDHLLQCAALKLELDDNANTTTPQYKVVGEPYVAYFHYQGKPVGDFQNKYLRPIFDKCKESDLTPAKFKDQFHAL